MVLDHNGVRVSRQSAESQPLTHTLACAHKVIEPTHPSLGTIICTFLVLGSVVASFFLQYVNGEAGRVSAVMEDRETAVHHKTC